MRRYIKPAVLFVMLTVLWYGLWSWLMVDDVARVRGTIAHHNQQFKERQRYAVLKAESVTASGFPFGFHVRIERLNLSMISGKETFAISLPELILAPEDAEQGRYRVILPDRAEALYARDGQAPENYTVTWEPSPDIRLRAWGDSGECSALPGAPRCAPAKPAAPLMSYALHLPKTLTLHMTLNGETQDTSFAATTLDIPIFEMLPQDIDRPLGLAVGMLREALVFKGK